MTRTGNKSNRPIASINVTPMVDVMLVLLIIFMITAPILAHQVDIDLPQGQPPPPDLAPPQPIDLRILASGALFWNGQPIVKEALEPQLRMEAKRQPQAQLQIDADRTTSYRVVAEVLATAKRAKIRKIGFESQSG